MSVGVQDASDAARLALLVAGRGLRGAHARLQGGWRPAWQDAAGATDAERLLLAPQDLRASDPVIAAEIYAGRFAFAGRMVATEGRSPFAAPVPSRAWAEELHGFGWLRHLRASERALSQANARALVREWIAEIRPRHAAGWDPGVTARRIVSWLAHAPMILEGADQRFHRTFVRSLLRQARYLRRAAADAELGLPRLLSAIALAELGLCLAGQPRLQRQSAAFLEDELCRQILPDGGHASRNPGVLIELLLDLLPLRQAFLARGFEPPRALLNAIDRMIPMLRFFRHRDGRFAAFNGMSVTPMEALATVLAYDDARGRPLRGAPHSGYQRIEAGRALIVVDAGRPPSLGFSRAAHAGCLSFEFSSGPARIVVNCGAPFHDDESWRMAARATAAHSTLTVEDSSSCRFVDSAALKRWIGTPILAGPEQVTVERHDRDGAATLMLTHDGYARPFGLVHARFIGLAADGARLVGEDVLRPVGREAEDRAYAVRFHLDPGVRVLEAGDATVRLGAAGETWLFEAQGLDAQIEESVCLAARQGPQRSAQIVLHGRSGACPRVAWSFTRLA